VNRTEKSAAVARMNERFAASPHVVVATFRGLTVNQTTELRGRVRRAGGRIHVIKNRLAKRAAVGTPVEPLLGHFTGPCALATHGSDPVGLAKVLADFSKANPQVELVAGIVDGQAVLNQQGLKSLALLPGMPELRAQLLRLIQTPATQLVRLLGTPGTQIARVLDARSERAEQG